MKRIAFLCATLLAVFLPANVVAANGTVTNSANCTFDVILIYSDGSESLPITLNPGESIPYDDGNLSTSLVSIKFDEAGFVHNIPLPGNCTLQLAPVPPGCVELMICTDSSHHGDIEFRC